MRLKNVNFNQPVRLLVNGVEYNFSNKISGKQRALNKGVVKYENVIPLNLSANQSIEQFTIFPKFARVEHYYGEQLFYLGFIREQSGSANPKMPKYVNIDVLDGKDWLTQSELIGQVYINETYEEVVEKLIAKINLPFIKKGKLQFEADGKIEGWDSNEVDAYSVLRFIEKQSDTIFQVLLEDDKTYSINFFSKDGIADDTGNKGRDLIIDTPEGLKTFTDDFAIIDINWRILNDKDYNIVRVSSERVISNISTHQKIDLAVVSDRFSLGENVGRFDNLNSILTDAGGKKIRTLRIITNQDAAAGRNYDIAYTQGIPEISINENLLKSTNIIELNYYPLRRGSVQFENNADQSQIAAYTGGTGRKARFEKHNDAGIMQHLIKYAKNYLRHGVEDKLELTVRTAKAPWNPGEHVSVKLENKQLNGIYYVKSVEVDITNVKAGEIFSEYEYLLTKTSDFEEHVNFYDNQSYREKPVFTEQKTLRSFENFFVKIKILAKPGTITCKSLDNDDMGLESVLEGS
jgi:hypothetical protein